MDLSKQWIKEYREKMNAYYANEAVPFPEFMNYDEYKYEPGDIVSVWVESTSDRIDLFYQDSKNRVPFPSLAPPAYVSKSNGPIGYGKEAIRDHCCGDGMPWPGDWAFSDSQLRVFGTPKQAEMAFRETVSGGKRRYINEDYLERLGLAFWSVQSGIRSGEERYISNRVIDLWFNRSDISGALSIGYINVRPCMQKRGLFTIFLYIIIEACLSSEQYVLGVGQAIEFTQEMFSQYGFTKIEGGNKEKVDMELRGVDAMQSALAKLSKKTAVKQLGNLRDLCELISRKWQTGCDEEDQTEEVKELLKMKEQYFGRVGHSVEEIERKYSNPRSNYYIDPRHFPTAAQLRDPEYVQSQFPKPNTLPERS